MEETEKIFLPGDEVAVSEEFESGEGTYEVDGVILAATVGRVDKDMKNRVVRIRPLNPMWYSAR